MGEIFQFHNPYNFVRPLKRKESPTIDKHPILMDKCPPPPHDRYIGLTGKIRCQLEVKTPLIIGMPMDTKTSGTSGREIEFFKMKNGDGTLVPTIPSASLRGVIRSLFEAVTNSCFSQFDKSKLFRRMEPKESSDFIPARLEKGKNGDWIARLFRGLNKEPKVTHPPLQFAAWIKVYRDESNNPKANRYQKRPRVEIPQQIKDGDRCYALIEKQEYNRGRFRFINVSSLHIEEPRNFDYDRYFVVEGYVYKKGQKIPRKHDERFFFPADSTETCEISKYVIEDYNALLIARTNDETLQDGILAWVKLDSDNKVCAIVPVAISKERYQRSRGDLLENHSLPPCKDISKLCPACRVFGWVCPANQEEEAKKPPLALKGRVRFSHASLNDPKSLKKAEIILTLASPKPTATFFYLLDDDGPSSNVHYDSEGARIRGRKFYLHHNNFELPQGKSEADGSDTTIKEYVEKGARFQFDVVFENLAEVELGALLWSLVLEDGMYHRLGMAKPYGFGSVKISVIEDGLLLCNMSERYTKGGDEGFQSIEQESFIQSFKTAIQKLYGSFDEMDNIIDLKSILAGPSDGIPIHYPRCKEVSSDDNKGYEWFMGAKKHKQMLPMASPLKPLDSKPCKKKDQQRQDGGTQRQKRYGQKGKKRAERDRW